MAANSVTTALSNILKVEISKGIREQRTKIDPVWEDIVSTSQGVVRDGMGQKWQFVQAFVSGTAGAFEFMGPPTGPSYTYPGGAAALDTGVLGTPQGFPARLESVVPAFFQRTITLREGRGNVYVPLKWHTLDQADGSVGSAVKATVTGVARKIANAYALAFFTSDSADFPVVTSLAASGIAATHTIEIDNGDAAKASGRIQMLCSGQVLDLYRTGDTIVNGEVVGDAWVVTKVDYLNQTFTIAAMTPALTEEIIAEDYLVLRGTTVASTEATRTQPAGLNTWIKSTGSPTVFGIAYDDHPEFKSLMETQSGPLTEAYLRNRIGAFIDRIGTMVDLDTILTPAGVIHSYMENEDNIMTIERNGKLLEMNHGWADLRFSYHGKPFRWAISTFIEAKSLYVTKFGGNNIKEYLPPATPGMGSGGEFGDVEFVGPAGGLSGIWAHENIGATAETAPAYAAAYSIGDNLQAPFWRMSELCPEQVQSIKTTGFDES